MVDENIKIEIDLLLQAIFLKYGYDFRNYARASLKRRLMRRLSLSNLKSIGEMQHRLLYDPKFFDQLLLDLSINVTEMFRDPFFYVAFKNQVLPSLKNRSHIKIWHAGCATGEEVYSLAILLNEAQLTQKTLIYATDFNQKVLNTGREGIYSADMIKVGEENYRKSLGATNLADYYTQKYGYVAIKSFLKKNIVFADHNLATDGSFGEMNAILCRNVFIYFNQELQNRAIAVFEQSLPRGGFLCLGTKETLRFSRYNDRFEVVDSQARIYRKK